MPMQLALNYILSLFATLQAGAGVLFSHAARRWYY